MNPAALLALLTIVLLAFAAFRLELNFRRSRTKRPEPKPSPSGTDRGAPALELRSAPAGGYWQAPFTRKALGPL